MEESGAISFPQLLADRQADDEWPTGEWTVGDELPTEDKLNENTVVAVTPSQWLSPEVSLPWMLEFSANTNWSGNLLSHSASDAQIANEHDHEVALHANGSGNATLRALPINPPTPPLIPSPEQEPVAAPHHDPLSQRDESLAFADEKLPPANHMQIHRDMRDMTAAVQERQSTPGEAKPAMHQTNPAPVPMLQYTLPPKSTGHIVSGVAATSSRRKDTTAESIHPATTTEDSFVDELSLRFLPNQSRNQESAFSAVARDENTTSFDPKQTHSADSRQEPLGQESPVSPISLESASSIDADSQKGMVQEATGTNPDGANPEQVSNSHSPFDSSAAPVPTPLKPSESKFDSQPTVNLGAAPQNDQKLPSTTELGKNLSPTRLRYTDLEPNIPWQPTRQAQSISIRIPLENATTGPSHVDLRFHSRQQDLTLQMSSQGIDIQNRIRETIPALIDKLRTADWAVANGNPDASTNSVPNPSAMLQSKMPAEVLPGDMRTTRDLSSTTAVPGTVASDPSRFEFSSQTPADSQSSDPSDRRQPQQDRRDRFDQAAEQREQLSGRPEDDNAEAEAWRLAFTGVDLPQTLLSSRRPSGR